MDKLTNMRYDDIYDGVRTYIIKLKSITSKLNNLRSNHGDEYYGQSGKFG